MEICFDFSACKVKGHFRNPLVCSSSVLASYQNEVVVMKSLQLRQPAQQAAEALRPPLGLAPTQPGQQVQDQLLHLLHTTGCPQRRSV